MQLPVYLREETEKTAQKYKPAELKKASVLLTDAYLNNKSDGARLVTTDMQAAAYAVVRMPATYAAVYTALRAATNGDGSGFQTVLDAGAGTGAAYFASRELLGIEKGTMVERESAMLSLAKRLCAAGNVDAEFIKSDLLSFTPTKKYDLVTASYAFNEMRKETREKLLDKLLSSTNKLLLIVEPGTPSAFRLQQEIRAYLKAKGATLTAPCPENAVCAISGDDWCHFSCRVERSRLHKFLKGGDSPYEDEKFTYSAFCVDGSLSACKARILRHPFTEKGKITLSVCSSDGIGQKSLFKGNEGYKEARKLSAGDALSQ